MAYLRDPSGRFVSLRKLTMARRHARLAVENAARLAGAKLIEWRDGKLLVRMPAKTERMP